MELEVGKKYVDRDGNVWTVIHKIDNLDFGHVALLNEGTEHEARAFFSMQGRRFGFDKSYDSEPSMKTLFKPYTPPRPDVEVLGDLIEHMNYHLEDVVNDVNGTPEQGCYSNTTPDKLRGLIKEAEEMKKRMESK